MANEKGKVNILGIVLLAVSLVGLVLAIVGVCTPWVKGVASSSLAGASESSSIKLFDIEKEEIEILGSAGAVGASKAFAILTIVAAAASLVLYALKTFGVLKLNKWILVGVGIATVVLGIVAIICGGSLVGIYQSKTGGDSIFGSLKFSVAVGAILSFLGGLVAGAPLVVDGLLEK